MESAFTPSLANLRRISEPANPKGSPMRNIKQDHAHSRKVVAKRIANGGDPERCPTCGQHPDRPHRRIVNGKIVEGCVDHSHAGRLVTPSASADWHNRPDARTIRAQTN